MVKQTGTPTEWNTPQYEQGTIHTTMCKNFRELRLVKKVSLMSLHAVWLYIYNILEIKL